LSTNPDKQQYLGFTSFNGLLWVVNASYYSMFYMARALLENEGIKIKKIATPSPRRKLKFSGARNH